MKKSLFIALLTILPFKNSFGSGIKDKWFYPEEENHGYFHVGGSAFLVLGTYMLLDKTNIKSKQAKIIISGLSAFILGFGKEGFDTNTGGYIDHRDIEQNIYGIDIGVLLIFSTEKIQKTIFNKKTVF